MEWQKGAFLAASKWTGMYRRLLAISGLFCLSLVAHAQSYPLTPDSERQGGVPQGRIESSKFTSTKWYPGTVRDLRVYIPAQYDPKTPACVLVMQDGGGYRIETVLDALIARGEVPVTIGIFLTPGVVPAKDDTSLPRYNRSFEYDSPTDTYVRFLLDEVLPEVGKKYNLSASPNDRAIAGASSGGIAAFTAAFFRPDAFRRVISFIGSYTDLRGATNYGSLVRKFEPKPIRVFLQEGRNDQDIYSGSWPIGNTDLEAGLKFARYDYQMVWGEGRHDGNHGTAVMPDALRFIWKDWPAPIELPKETPQPVMRWITPGAGWQKVATDSPFVAPPKGRRDTAGPYSVGEKGLVWHQPKKGKARTVATLDDAGGIVLSPDQSLVFVSSRTGRYVRSYQVQPDGGLMFGQDYHEVYVPWGQTQSQAGSMACDTDGWLYLASVFGVQVLDQAGRVNGILTNPPGGPTVSVRFGGEGRKMLFALCADGSVWVRPMRVVGADPAQPTKPNPPRL
jgi:gluconolactonase